MSIKEGVRYSRTAMAYAEECIQRYTEFKREVEAAREEAIYSFVGGPLKGDGQPKAAKRKSDPTLNSVQKMLDDPETLQLRLAVNAVEKMRETLAPGSEHEAFYLKHFEGTHPATDLYEKRVRRYILSLVCYYLGVPPIR